MKKFLLLFVSICIMLSTAMSASAISISSMSNETMDYFNSFDFEECYTSETLSNGVKDRLRTIEAYISEHSYYTLDDLNQIVDTIDATKVISVASTESYDYSTLLPDSENKLNAQEIEIFNSNPTWGAVVLVQADYANRMEAQLFGSNTWATNGDAFRHALWNAMGARGTSDSYMESFATAHETGSTQYDPNSIDTQMDLHNNEMGRELLKGMSFPSRPANGMTIPYIIRTGIATAVANGQMKRFVANGARYDYLIPTNSSSSN